MKNNLSIDWMKKNGADLRQTEQCCSSLPSPHPSRPEQTIAELRHRPLPHFSGQYRLPRAVAKLDGLWNVFVITTLDPHKCGGSSLPSRHEMIALQNSYSGKHSPERQGNVFAGHLLDLRKSQLSSSSPSGHWTFPSQSAAFETHFPLRWHLNACCGHCAVEFASLDIENMHSSSDPS